MLRLGQQTAQRSIGCRAQCDCIGVEDWRFAGRLVTAVLEPLMHQVWPNEIRHGIRIVDPSAKTWGDFVNAADEALLLIKQNDRRRFTRLGREIKAIINLPCETGSLYSRFQKVCRIDLACIPTTTDKKAAVTLPNIRA